MEFNGTAAGVPVVALPPSGGARPDAPTVVAYHLLDAPRTPEAFASAVPLDGLDAWKVYFGLPLSGKRMPADDLWQMLTRDAVLEVHQHVTVDHQVVAGMAHALADEPGTGPAPQTPHAAEVDRLATEWFRRHLPTG